MKVDKAVCTNGTLEDLTKALKYRAVFTTLIENKVLSNKRECELKMKSKKKRRKNFKKLIFGKKVFRNKELMTEITSQNSEVLDMRRTSSIPNATISRPIENGNNNGIDTISLRESHNLTNQPNQSMSGYLSSRLKHIEPREPPPPFSICSDTQSDIIVVQDKTDGFADDTTIMDSNLDCSLIVDDLSQYETHTKNEFVSNQLSSDMTTNNYDLKNFPRVHLRNPTTNISLNQLSNDNSSIWNKDDVQSLTYTSAKDIIPSLSSPACCSGADSLDSMSFLYTQNASRLHVIQAKSISAQCSPILSRNTMPFNYKMQLENENKNGKYNGKEDSKEKENEMENNKEKDVLVSRSYSNQKEFIKTGKIELETITSRPIINPQLNENDFLNSFNERKSKSTSLLVVSNVKNDNNLENNTSSYLNSNNSFNKNVCNSNNKPLVVNKLLSSLKASKNYVPALTLSARANTNTNPSVIALANIRSCSSPKSEPITKFNNTTSTNFQQIDSTSTSSESSPPLDERDLHLHINNNVVNGNNTQSVRRTYNHNWIDANTTDEDSVKKSKRKYKRTQRHSDPMIVFPTSGLQQCILSIPPNTIQVNCSPDIMYDMTLQMDSDKNELKTIVEQNRSNRHHNQHSNHHQNHEHLNRHHHHHHHHHHRHHHHHKNKHHYNKSKILVHDLDTRRIKMIDPDELSERARWTIIATAFLLLLMCLMLVGITLRMAPIIDEMVRQENVRLQESMNRVIFPKNLTEQAAAFAAIKEAV